MTVEIITTSDTEHVGRVGEHVEVVGATVSGLGAQVLVDVFDRVTVVEHDTLPDEPAARDGPPRTQQPHRRHQ